MNDTILTSRQNQILTIINQSEGLLREEISSRIINLYPTSKPTLIRDLNTLIKLGLIKTTGKAKATHYVPASKNPLLRTFDIDKYFLEEPDQRLAAKTTFDPNVFGFLNNILLPHEMDLLAKYGEGLEEKTKNLSPDLIKRELERFVIELSWKSSKIEGNTYTLLETESLIKDQKVAKGKSRAETIMILNHKTAFDMLLGNKDMFKKLNLQNINQLHNVLVKDLEITTGIRKHEVGITGTVYKPSGSEHQLREFMERFIKVLNETENGYEKALIASAMVPYIQPYTDGNKRTARMLCNGILLANNLLPISYRSVDEEEFKKSLIIFYEQLSIVGIKRIFLGQVKFANENYF